jgi:2-iminobutanoate/2-iminopropanoate deaminase
MTSKKEVVQTDAYPTPFPVMPFSAAVKINGMVYLSGNIGMDPKTNKIVEGDIRDRTVRPPFRTPTITPPTSSSQP